MIFIFPSSIQRGIITERVPFKGGTKVWTKSLTPCGCWILFGIQNKAIYLNCDLITISFPVLSLSSQWFYFSPMKFSLNECFRDFNNSFKYIMIIITKKYLHPPSTHTHTNYQCYLILFKKGRWMAALVVIIIILCCKIATSYDEDRKERKKIQGKIWINNILQRTEDLNA